MGNMNRIIQIKAPLPYEHELSGKFCFVTKDKRIIGDRKGVIAKVFFKPLIGDIEDYRWGHDFPIQLEDGETRDESSLLSEASVIQAICAYHGLAPKIYEVGLIENLWDETFYPFQIVEEARDVKYSLMHRKLIFDQIKKLGDQHGFEFVFKDIGMESNIMDGQLIDFQGLCLKPDYYKHLLDKYKNNCSWKGNTYQATGIPDIDKDIPDAYRSEERADILVRNVQFYDKKVLDIGCSGGRFCRLALASGASKVVGIDLPSVVEGAMELSAYAGYFDIEWKPMILNREAIDHQLDMISDFDLVFFLSMNRHIGFPEALLNVPCVVYEHNGDEPVDIVIDKFKSKGYGAKDLGVTGKNDVRHTYIFSNNYYFLR